MIFVSKSGSKVSRTRSRPHWSPKLSQTMLGFKCIRSFDLPHCHPCHNIIKSASIPTNPMSGKGPESHVLNGNNTYSAPYEWAKFITWMKRRTCRRSARSTRFSAQAQGRKPKHEESEPNPFRSSSSWFYHLQKNSDKKDDGMTSYKNTCAKPLPSAVTHKIINWNRGHCTQRPRHVRIRHRAKCCCGQPMIQFKINHSTARNLQTNHKPRTHDPT